MSYSIAYDTNEFDENGNARYENISWNILCNNDDFIIGAEQFLYWFEKESNKDKKESIDNFKNSENFYQLRDSYYPIYNYVHILQYSPSDAEILKILENAPNIAILHDEDLGVHLISLTGCGMDFSDSIAYAYMIIDRVIPKDLIPNQRLTISQSAYDELIAFVG